MRMLTIAILGGAAVGAIALFTIVASFSQSGSSPVDQSGGTTAIVPLDQIVSGGPPRDGIPSIDNPKFLSADKAALEDFELVLGLDISGDVRAYPLSILVWHEIVNDEVGGEPVAVTYCPLCFTNQVFKRTIDGQTVEFGTSGKLYNSNLVMYDRTSESLWSQALGQAIAGEYAGKTLERLPFDVAYWRDWKNLYPESIVLSSDTGFGRPYGADPYGSYYSSPDILFPIANRDDRLGPKEIVVGLESGGTYRAYPIHLIEESSVINDAISGEEIALMSLYPFMVRAFDRTVDGLTLEFAYDGDKIVDQTGSVWNFEGEATEGEMAGKKLVRLPFDEGYWFEWVAFHPETELYR